MHANWVGPIKFGYLLGCKWAAQYHHVDVSTEEAITDYRFAEGPDLALFKQLFHIFGTGCGKTESVLDLLYRAMLGMQLWPTSGIT